MKIFLVLLISMCSLSASASDCTESDREFKAVLAATQVEMMNMGESWLTREIIPMNAQAFYKIRFSYPGFQHFWRVYVDDFTCEIKSVIR